ncbi:hypothetical protein CLM62_26405 [Streptomyces sp. SA15]|uniref:hypothetical protein n=1 Tax=Streptomyces sp. SA15 TaxID=934019 RepID=UPI000BB04990|nr:hypothetical protein [Streptomyces sp. SA15]PAZ13037.1 hypothetical protein CLM62_26405 [Streptomyces sp. SA15]
MIKNPRSSLIGWGVALATAATATVTIGATTGGPPNPLPVDPQTRPTAGRDKEPQTEPQATERRQIATSVLGRDFKFTLTALRSQTDPLAASVRLQVFTFKDGAWRESDRALVGDVDGWFWFPLTGRRAVCEFSTASTEPAPVAVSLLVTPSIGCSPTENFQIENGQITPA